MGVNLARMGFAAFAHESQQKLGLFSARRRPEAAALRARMHQRLDRAGDEAIRDEIILRYVELCVAAFEVAGVVAVHTMAQDEVLRAGRRADGVGLDEAESLQCAL